ncbi:MAG: tetratricopeptide repeat protein [Pyrinomonadaceae bacterium]
MLSDNEELNLSSSADCLKYGLEYFANCEYGRAISFFNKVLEINGKKNSDASNIKTEKTVENQENFTALFNRGLIYMVLGSYLKAINSFSGAVKINPVSSEAFFQRALAHEKSGDYEETLEDYSTVIKLDPSNFAAFYRRGMNRFGPDRFKYVLEDLSRAIELKPDFIEAFFERAKLFADNNHLDEALSDYEKIIHITPYSKDAYVHRLRIFQSLNNKEKCIEVCENYSKQTGNADCICTYHPYYRKPPEPKYIRLPCQLCDCVNFSEAHMGDPKCMCGHDIDLHKYST